MSNLPDTIYLIQARGATQSPDPVDTISRGTGRESALGAFDAYVRMDAGPDGNHWFSPDGGQRLVVLADGGAR